MATREELRLFRDARAGNVVAQIALGMRYLNGEGTCTKSEATALYWLDRAALNGAQDAWLLIGRRVGVDTALRSQAPERLICWYERAFDAGVTEAGVAFARLVLQQEGQRNNQALQAKAWEALEFAASAGIPEAQWWLAQYLAFGDATRVTKLAVADGKGGSSGYSYQSLLRSKWLVDAAENGLFDAQRTLAELALAELLSAAPSDRWIAPVARRIAEGGGRDNSERMLSEQDARLLCRCTQRLFSATDYDPAEIERFWQLAAQSGDADAQLALGLWFARMNADGERDAKVFPVAEYGKALYWLTAAGEQGNADAWYVIAKLYGRRGFSSHSPMNADRFLEKAAEEGHVRAQLELARKAWRGRQDEPSNDIRAAYWLQKAAALGNAEAQAFLGQVAALASPSPWASSCLSTLGHHIDPCLRARIELAAVFGLTEAEALLLDMRSADRRHCLLVDIRSSLPRSRRRLILIRTGEQRQTLNRVLRLFENIDCTVNGPEGNYRQRMYRLKAVVSAARHDAKEAASAGQHMALPALPKNIHLETSTLPEREVQLTG